MTRLKIGVFGYGSAGRRLALEVRDRGHRVVVHDPQIPAGTVDEMTFVDDPADVLRTDAVIVASPAPTHAALFWQAAPRPVFVEKPLACSVADFLAFAAVPADAIDRAVRVGQVGCNLRYYPGVRMLRQRLDGFVRFPPKEAVFWVFVDRSTWPGQTYADTLLECGSHEIDLALYLLGRAEVCHVERFRVGRQTEATAGWAISLTHAAGTRSKILINDQIPNHYTRGVWVQGAGSYVLTPGPDVTETYRLEVADFLARVAGDPSPTPDVAPARISDGYATLRILDDVRGRVAGA